MGKATGGSKTWNTNTEWENELNQVKRNRNVVAGMEQGKKCMGKTKIILKTNAVGGGGANMAWEQLKGQS